VNRPSSFTCAVVAATAASVGVCGALVAARLVISAAVVLVIFGLFGMYTGWYARATLDRSADPDVQTAWQSARANGGVSPTKLPINMIGTASAISYARHGQLWVAMVIAGAVAGIVSLATVVLAG
jgi:hypothetical protein